jgi:hypothetical protein
MNEPTKYNWDLHAFALEAKINVRPDCNLKELWRIMTDAQHPSAKQKPEYVA